MTDKEKIMAEVERLRDLHQYNYQLLDSNDYRRLIECGKRNLCNDLLSFIDLLPKEPVSEDLEKAARDYCGDGPEWQPDRCLFVAGAKWKEQQMMKDAVDVYVCTNLDKTRKIPCSTEWGGRIPWNAIFENRNVGDKVKLIIVKDD